MLTLDEGRIWRRNLGCCYTQMGCVAIRRWVVLLYADGLCCYTQMGCTVAFPPSLLCPTSQHVNESEASESATIGLR